MESLEIFPVCVDLDGTLIYTDSSIQTAFLLIKHKPWILFFFPFWFLKGRAYVKQCIAQRINLDPGSLKYHIALLEYLKTEYHKGRYLILATGADIRIAQSIAQHLGIFHKVLASDGQINLTGHNKWHALQKHKITEFIYAGNAPIDLKLWYYAKGAILVTHSQNLYEKLQALACPILQYFKVPSYNLSHYILQSITIEWEEWLPNFLIFSYPLYLFLQGKLLISAERIQTFVVAWICFYLVKILLLLCLHPFYFYKQYYYYPYTPEYIRLFIFSFLGVGLSFVIGIILFLPKEFIATYLAYGVLFFFLYQFLKIPKFIKGIIYILFFINVSIIMQTQTFL